MATIKYLLQSETNNAPIYLRLSLGRNKLFKRKTGLSIDYRNWSRTTGLPKQNDELNKSLAIKLRNLESFVLSELNESNSKGIDINGDWLIKTINQHFDRSEVTNLNYLIEYGEYFIENIQYRVSEKGTKGVSVSTKRKYRTIVNKLISFENFKKTKILLTDVDLKFRNELIKYLSIEDKLGDNTIGRYLKFVKSICLDAQKNGQKLNDQLRHFKGYTVKAPKVFLSLDELGKIKNANFTNENHEIARDWLIIGFYTGQRVSDLLRMTNEFIQTIQDFNFIVLEQVKTGKIVQIPIHYEVKVILDKRNGMFPPVYVENIDSNKALFNRYLKQLCEIAKIDSVVEGNCFNKETKRNENGMFEKYKLVSSHICRRSFSTNFYGNPKYPTPLLMNITAHSTEKMFLDYIGKKPIDYSLELARIWAKENLKTNKEPRLHVIKNVSNN
ncbi:MAG: hypothetical protein HOF75_08705 [Flavobacteriaceae bacterium]|jgi:integrase|nr:hypothetical protein [Flavobacteriaceae bacterium]MBT3920543.1 hypothetical protein [Flavobacteriaceae bacterium]MBT6705309.1 hypothetical protein [Flavobacteriaceae bacterium]